MINLAAVPEFVSKFVGSNAQALFKTAPSDPSSDLGTQLAKVSWAPRENGIVGGIIMGPLL